MKAKILVTELTHDELVNIFSTALHRSSSLAADYDIDYYDALPAEKKHGLCFEDRLADIVLAGGKVKLLDLEADGPDDFHGLLDHEYVTCEENPDFDYAGAMVYDVSLADICRGCGKPEAYKELVKLLDGDGDFYTAWNIIQYIIFGKVIYG